MKGNDNVIDQLNARLAEELTAINQYMVHAEMCDNWKYARLAEVIEKRAIQEMKHAETLIERILYLEGRPVVSKLNDIHIGEEVPDMHKNDLGAEVTAVKGYNESVRVAREAGDDGTAKILEAILRDEEDHVDWLESQLDQIKQISVERYLSQQIY